MYITMISGYEYSITLNSFPSTININIHLYDDKNDVCPIETKEFVPPLPEYPHPDDVLTPIMYHDPIKIQSRRVYSRKLQHVDII